MLYLFLTHVMLLQVFQPCQRDTIKVVRDEKVKLIPCLLIAFSLSLSPSPPLRIQLNSEKPFYFPIFFGFPPPPVSPPCVCVPVVICICMCVCFSQPFCDYSLNQPPLCVSWPRVCEEGKVV